MLAELGKKNPDLNVCHIHEADADQIKYWWREEGVPQRTILATHKRLK